MFYFLCNVFAVGQVWLFHETQINKEPCKEEAVAGFGFSLSFDDSDTQTIIFFLWERVK